MSDDELDLVPMLAVEIRTLAEELAHMQQTLHAINTEILRSAKLRLQYAPENELEPAFVNYIDSLRRTIR